MSPNEKFSLVIEKMQEWTIQSLLEKEYEILSEFENIQETAWSSVNRVLTKSGYIYVKQIPSVVRASKVIRR